MSKKLYIFVYITLKDTYIWTNQGYTVYMSQPMKVKVKVDTSATMVFVCTWNIQCIRYIPNYFVLK
jgi:hypothetical protein